MHLKRRASLLHSEADVLIKNGAAIAEDVEEDGMLVAALLGDDLDEPAADAGQPVPPPKQILHRGCAAQRNAAVSVVARVQRERGYHRTQLYFY